MAQSIFALSLIGSLLALSQSGCVKLPHGARPRASQIAPATSSALKPPQPSPLNINNASAEELERLPGIGRALAARIVSHRAEYGPFRRAEHLIMVRGVGDKRFRRLRPFITVQ